MSLTLTSLPNEILSGPIAAHIQDCRFLSQTCRLMRQLLLFHVFSKIPVRYKPSQARKYMSFQKAFEHRRDLLQLFRHLEIQGTENSDLVNVDVLRHLASSVHSLQFTVIGFTSNKRDPIVESLCAEVKENVRELSLSVYGTIPLPTSDTDLPDLYIDPLIRLLNSMTRLKKWVFTPSFSDRISASAWDSFVSVVDNTLSRLESFEYWHTNNPTLAALVANSLANASRLRVLHLGYVPGPHSPHPPILEGLSRNTVNPGIEELILTCYRHNPISDLAQLLGTIPVLSQLRKLKLTSMHCDDLQFTAIMAVVGSSATLQAFTCELARTATVSAARGGEAIVNAFARSTSLRTVKVDGRCFDDALVLSLGRSTVGSSTLVDLRVTDSWSVSHEAKLALVGMLEKGGFSSSVERRHMRFRRVVSS
ncbi:hypothetical protein BJ742DRAFT_788691 [Cladochytrium replicatum]|nr:hypothetical protein BJ742DRAFT_788691 [Cladochytrium replicatum]